MGLVRVFLTPDVSAPLLDTLCSAQKSEESQASESNIQLDSIPSPSRLTHSVTLGREVF